MFSCSSTPIVVAMASDGYSVFVKPSEGDNLDDLTPTELIGPFLIVIFGVEVGR